MSMKPSVLIQLHLSIEAGIPPPRPCHPQTFILNHIVLVQNKPDGESKCMKENIANNWLK